jgi:hypothetical protein
VSTSIEGTPPATARTGKPVAVLGASIALLALATGVLAGRTLETRYERDVSRMVFNDNVELLNELRSLSGVQDDSLARLQAIPVTPTANMPYIVVSIEDHRLWYRLGDSVLFSAPVATGTGMVLEKTGADAHWRFETPRGRLSVVSKEIDPTWVAPDWHYVEQAQRLGLGVVRLRRGERISMADGSAITVVGSDVVKRSRDGRLQPLEAGEDRELVVDGNVVIPPFGTNQRKFKGVLGTRRLNIGDGYGLHGTNKPETVGQSVSHGCVRLRNGDIEQLYEMVPLGTPVFIY